MNNNFDTEELLAPLDEPRWKKMIREIKFPSIAAFLFFLISFGFVIYYIVGPSRGYLHSDCTDSLLWAYASVESGEIIAQDFYYAGLFPFSSNLWMIPLIQIFGYTMTAQIISMVIFAVLFTASLVWLFKNLRFSWTLNFTATACVLMLLSSSVKMREIMWEHVIYYSLSLLLLNCILSLVLSLLRRWDVCNNTNEKKPLTSCIVYLVILCALITASSTNGLQIVMLTVIPVVGALAVEMYLDAKKKLLCSQNIGAIAVIFLSPVSTVLGLLLLNIMKGNVQIWYTNYYTQLDSIDNWINNLFKFHKHFTSLIGYDDSKTSILPKEGESLLEDSAILNVLVIVVFLVLVIVPMVAMFFMKKYKHRESRIMLWTHFILFFVIFFLFVCGKISNVAWRLVPIVGTSLMAIFVVVNELLEYRKENRNIDEEERNYVPVRIAAVLLIGFCLFSMVNIRTIKKMPADYGRDNHLYKLTETLIEHDLDYGYATFWYSQAITLLSDSEVSCRCVNATSDSGIKMYNYQTFDSWYDPQPDVSKYFVLLSEYEALLVSRNETWLKWVNDHYIETITDVPGFVIFVFDGYLEGIK